MSSQVRDAPDHGSWRRLASLPSALHKVRSCCSLNDGRKARWFDRGEANAVAQLHTTMRCLPRTGCAHAASCLVVRASPCPRHFRVRHLVGEGTPSQLAIAVETG